jgi:hypothetical protein
MEVEKVKEEELTTAENKYLSGNYRWLSDVLYRQC